MTKLPMLEKRVDAVVGVWKIFGTYPDGSVDVDDGNRDVFTELAPDVAAKVIDAHDRFREELYSILCDWGGKS